MSEHPVFVKIDEREFANLVKGRVVEVDGRHGPDLVPVRVILADIGFAKMLSYIDRAINDQDRFGG